MTDLPNLTKITLSRAKQSSNETSDLRENSGSLSKISTQVNKKEAIATILSNAKTLRGFKLKELTEYLKVSNPESMLHAKGFTGQLIEILLGATAKSKPLPDFPELGLEIKTLPIDLQGNPLETTYVCTASLIPKVSLADLKDAPHSQIKPDPLDFKNSTVYKKLRHVLWLPILVPNKNLADRIIGSAFLWQPNAEEYNALEKDWLELTEMLHTGEIDKVSSYYGEVLQIRPKARDASVTTIGLGETGEKIATLPRGFYLRTSFTKSVCSYCKNHTDILP